VVEEVGCEAGTNFSLGEIFSMSKKWVLKPMGRLSRRETTWNCSMVHWEMATWL
jgi:hypothetical protein